jgi:hypothetical protein
VKLFGIRAAGYRPEPLTGTTGKNNGNKAHAG